MDVHVVYDGRTYEHKRVQMSRTPYRIRDKVLEIRDKVLGIRDKG
jgi:hypothetical protein